VALLASGAIAAVYGLRDGVLTLALLVALGVPALVVAAVTAFAVVIALRAVQLMGGGVMDDAERTRRDLVAAVSHDLRTPITSLRLLTDAISDDVVEEETRRSYLAQISTHLNALSALIDDLFELSRLEAGDIEWSREQVRLDELVGETVDAMRVQADARHVEVRAELPPGQRPAHGDPREAPARAVQPDPERDPPHPRGRLGRRARPVERRRGGDRGRRHGRRHRRARPRARVRAVLPRRRGTGS
jgi:signal transduction histidine kinase